MDEQDQDYLELEDDFYETEEPARDHSGVENADDPVLLYLREIGGIEILDAEDEFRLAVLIQAGRSADQYLENNIIETGEEVLQDFSDHWFEYLKELSAYNKSNPEEIPVADLKKLLADALTISPVESQKKTFYLYAYMNQEDPAQEQKPQDKRWKKVFSPLFDSFLALCLMTKELNKAVSDFYADQGTLPFADDERNRLEKWLKVRGKSEKIMLYVQE